ncbi:MAG: hypothetical protein M1837_002846 [Sclerophora amabilis]|nr:MAG: hypothetical protein M1837_002846 [Sclerophora amabilis]
MAPLADQPVNIISNDMTDFVLFPGQESYNDIMSHQQSRQQEQENAYGVPPPPHYYTDPAFDGHHSGIDMTSADSYPTMPAYSSGYDAPQFTVEAPQEAFKQGLFQTPPHGSPAMSASHSLDHATSTLSSASGASVPSAASSANASPYSNATRLIHPEHWTPPNQGLGLLPGIVQTDGYGHELFVPSGPEPETLLASDKLPNGYVGEWGVTSSSSSEAMTSTSFSASDFPSSLPASVPSLALNTSGLRGPGVTIDTILDEINSQAGTPYSASPSSAGPTRRNSVLGIAHTSPSHEENVFKSPVTPASARSNHSPRPLPPRVAAPRRRSTLTGAGVTKSTRTSSLSPKPFSARLPTPPETSENPQRPQDPYQSSFFSQSSGNFIAPLESSYPSLIQPFQPFNNPPATSTPQTNPVAAFHSPQTSYFHPPSPALSSESHQGRRPGSAKMKTGSASPYLHNTSFQPYPPYSSRRLSVSSDRSRFSTHGSQGSPQSGSLDIDDDGKERGKCPNPDCGKVFKDLKAHMLTHQSERPEKCPIVTCEYHHKGFARKYDKQRHTLTHYKGTMVCGFCPHSGSSAEKSFNRADVFKRHLMSVHGVEQTPPNSRKKSSTAVSKKLSQYPQDVTGKCSTCSCTFSNAQDFYEHLDECVLRIVQQEEPSEAINEMNMTSVESDQAVEETLRAHALPTGTDYSLEPSFEEEDDEDDEEQDKVVDDDNNTDELWTGSAPSSGKGRSGKSAIKSGGVPLVGKAGKKRRKNFPFSWGCPPEKMKMKKRVLCVWDGPRRLWKDDMMLDNEFEVRLSLGDGKSYVTDLDVETIKRAEAFHNATDEEKGPWLAPHEDADINIQALMS